MTAAPRVTWYPVTSSRVAVLVAGVSGTVQLRSLQGQVLASGTGTVCLSAAVPGNTSSHLVLAVGSDSLRLPVSTTAAALAASPWRVTNKRNALPSTFIPSTVVASGGYRLRADCVAACGNLRRAALTAGYPTGFTGGAPAPDSPSTN